MQIEHKKNLKTFNTFGLSAVADYYCRPSSLDELRQAFHFIRDHALEYVVLGGGSNILFSKERYHGLVIHLDFFGKEITHIGSSIVVKAGASEVWDEFVHYCIDQNIQGLENLSLIPGTVGACPVQNVGAYGVEVSDFIDGVECYDPESDELLLLSNADCCFAYRDSLFKQSAKRMVILAVTFRFVGDGELKLGYGDVARRVEQRCIEQNLATVTPLLVSQVISEIRSEKLPDPTVLGNTGSFFKNPIVSKYCYDELVDRYPNLVAFKHGEKYKLAAGWMIDSLGMKGEQIGGAAVHQKQALVLINKTGSATVDDLFSLVERIQERVNEAFGVELEVEPVTL
jgi:UDP-N-acetylmuramate dehydrogenase